MNRLLIFFASLVLTFVTISSACSASEWKTPKLAARSGAAFGGGALTGALGSTPSRLGSIDVIRL